ncbi:MAG: Mini-ribonuclease 3 [Halanaerobiales bacterium]|nr:Mini-ribonuclease 3 [Halanaerobiales bacterium]
MLEQEVRLLSAGLLAYVGDSVYELKARTYLVRKGYRNAKKIHQAAVNLVKASAQAQVLLNIESALSEAEKNIVRRGRNNKTGSVPSNVDISEYRISTGLEALFGYHFLCGNEERIYHLWDLVVASLAKDEE